MQKNQGFSTPILYHKHPKKCTIFQRERGRLPFFKCQCDPIPAILCPSLWLFAPLPEGFPPAQRVTALKTNLVRKLFLTYADK